MICKECPKCGVDISDSHQEDDPDTGIVGGYYCVDCNIAIESDDGNDYD